VSEYSEFFLNSKSSIVQLELLEIAHSSFLQTYRVVRNAVNGVIVDHNDGSGTWAYEYCPMQIGLTGPRDDLDQILSVNFGDLGTIFSENIEAVREDDTSNELPTVVYRTYRSDVLTEPLYGPLFLQIRKIAMTNEGAKFEARAPSLNKNKTGEKYSLARFPMLKGLL